MAWTCQRVSKGNKCRAVNANRYRKCQTCGKLRRPRRKPAHLAAMKLPREDFVAINGGEACGICGAVQKPGGKRLHRDHDHRAATPRGILCFQCNAAIRPYMTLEWARGLVAYLERAAASGYSGGVPDSNREIPTS